MKKLTSPAVLIIAFILAVGFNLPHLVATHPASDLPTWYIWAVFLVIDLAILILAINGDDIACQTFAVIVFFLNLFYHWAPLQFPGSYYEYVQATPGLMLSFIAAFLVYYLSNKIAERINDLKIVENVLERSENDVLNKENVNLQNQINGLRLENESLRNENDIATRQNKQLRKYEAVISNLMASPEQLTKNMKVTFCKNLHLVGVSNSAKSVNCKKCN